MKKASKKDLTTSQQIRRIGVLVEMTNKNVNTLVEGHAVLDKKIDAVDKKIDFKIDELRGEMDYKFGVVFDELHLIKNQMVKREEFMQLEKRVLEVEKRLSHQK